jgi:phage-related minor tail protein
MPTQIDDLTIRVSADTAPCRAALQDLGREATSFSAAITGAFKSAIAGGRDFESVLKSLALKLAGIAFDRALAPMSNAIGGAIDNLFGAFGLAQGGAVGGGQVKPFARGGVVATPSFFPLGRGLGMMGEAGAEAVLPLARGSDGRLGIRSDGERPIVVTFNVTAADADSFRKSEAQVSAMLARAVGRGRRGL